MVTDNKKSGRRSGKARGRLLPLVFIGPHLILFSVFVLSILSEILSFINQILTVGGISCCFANHIFVTPIWV